MEKIITYYKLGLDSEPSNGTGDIKLDQWKCFFFDCYGIHRDLHPILHSFPTRRSSDLIQDLRRVTTLNDEVAIGRRDESGLLTPARSEEHTSELQSHSAISYAVFCL